MRSNSMEQYQVLRKWLEGLNPIQFREMIIALLSPTEQDELSQPLTTLTKGAFLNDMNRWGKLDSVEEYLREKFPNRFSE